MHISTVLAAGLLSLAQAAPTNELLPRAGKFQFFGVNEAGGEFGETNLPGVWGKDFIFPDTSTIPTFTSKGFNTFRVGFRMERLTPGSLTSGFSSGYLANLTKTVNAITNGGSYVVLDPHNYGRFNGQIITDTNAFGTWWKNVAAQFKGNSKVIFDVNNEFNTMSGALVASLNQAAITNIRAAGATSQYIAVEGNSWTGAWTWTTTPGTDGQTNAQTMGALTDLQNKILYELHQYLDSDGSGTSTTCVNATVGSARLVAATNWMRANKKKALLGEFAGGVNAVCQSAVKDMLAYMGRNSDVWVGALWWAAGPWWGDYIFSLEPSSGVAYSTYLPILQAAQAG